VQAMETGKSHYLSVFQGQTKKDVKWQNPVELKHRETHQTSKVKRYFTGRVNPPPIPSSPTVFMSVI